MTFALKPPQKRRTIKRLNKQPYAAKEWHEQRIVFEWAKLNEGREPRLALLNGSMNGLQVSNPGIIVRAKLCGLKPGYPDIDLPVPFASPEHFIVVFSGLHIEQKRKHAGWEKCGWKCASVDQQWWRDALRAQGRRVEVSHSGEETIAIIKDHLGMKQ